jgi:flagellar biosynthetic protein FlhB
MVFAGAGVTVGQIGFLFTTKPLAPKLDRINPISGFGRIFSMRSLVELFKSLAKLTFISYVVLAYLRNEVDTIILLMHQDPLDALGPISALVIGVWWRIAMVMLVLGMIDYAYQWWQHEQDLRMTTQEARQEAKELEGDPHIKRRVRQLQRQIASQRMMAAVPEADVVITNPTHYAVALRYDAENMNAPIVVAKGMRLVAQRIREIAVENRVPIVQKPPLARELHRLVEVNNPVPEGLFVAVAEGRGPAPAIDVALEVRRQLHHEPWVTLEGTVTPTRTSTPTSTSTPTPTSCEGKDPFPSQSSIRRLLLRLVGGGVLAPRTASPTVQPPRCTAPGRRSCHPSTPKPASPLAFRMPG